MEPSTEAAGTAPASHMMGVEYFSIRGNKTDQIINGVTPIKGENRWYGFTFSRPVYLRRLVIKAEGYTGYNSFDLIVDHVDGTHHEQRIPVDSGIIELSLGKLSSGFRFRPDSKMFSHPRIESVQVFGLSIEEFHAFEWFIKDYDKNLASLKQREDGYAALSEKIKDLSATKNNLDAEIVKKKAELDGEKASLALLRAESGAADKALDAVTEKLESGKLEYSQLSARVSEARSKLNELVGEIRLLPSEIAQFVREGNRSITQYSVMGAPFLVILGIILCVLFTSAADLSTIWRREAGIDVWVIFLTRLPFVVVAAALVEVCGIIVGRILFEVIRINRQRLDFAKLGIIAKDVSVSSAKGTALTDDEIFERETKLKMELLREHMKNYTGGEFEYKGSGIINAIAGVAGRLIGDKGSKAD